MIGKDDGGPARPMAKDPTISYGRSRSQATVTRLGPANGARTRPMSLPNTETVTGHFAAVRTAENTTDAVGSANADLVAEAAAQAARNRQPGPWRRTRRVLALETFDKLDHTAPSGPNGDRTQTAIFADGFRRRFR